MFLDTQSMRLLQATSVEVIVSRRAITRMMLHVLNGRIAFINHKDIGIQTAGRPIDSQLTDRLINSDRRFLTKVFCLITCRQQMYTSSL